MKFLPLHPGLLTLAVSLSLSATIYAQDPQTADDEVVMMQAFNVSAYGGEITIIDGFTGKEYKGNNDLVFDFASSFNKLLLGFHRKLVTDEFKHMKFRLQLGEQFEDEMGKLTDSLGFNKFTLDRTNWLTRERSIVSRLIKEPFFKIKALVVWDIDRLNQMAPEKPKSKYADDIHFNTGTHQWERRITTKWEVFFRNNPNNNNAFFTDKQQGLNLDTLKGYHFIERGLPSQIPPYAFKEVKLTYPIFYSEYQTGEDELKYLQESFVANLFFIYDPFSWVARRETRFRGGFGSDCIEHIRAERIYVDDRQWFDSMLAKFLSDVVTIKLQGAEEIYDLHLANKRLGESPRTLGVGLDLLNWNPKEKREAIEKPAAKIHLNHKNSSGFRYLMIDAYQRHGDQLIDQIRTQLLAQKETRTKINGEAMIKQIIEGLSGMPFDQFGKRAMSTQLEQLDKHRVSR